MGLWVLRPEPETVTDVSPAPTNQVVALGRLEPAGGVIKLSVPNAADSRVNQILVREGDQVIAGQVIAVLQGIERRNADLRSAQAEVRLRAAELAKAQQGEAKRAQVAAQQAAIAQLNAQLQTETRQRQAAVASAEAALQEAQLSYERYQMLATAGAISRADLDQAQLALSTAEATRVEREAGLAQTIQTLQAQLTRAQAQLAELNEVLPVDVTIAQESLNQARIEVEQRLADLEDAQVRAPVAGQILRINTRIGEQVNTTQGIVELARTDEMYAVAEVPEIDIPRVAVGQQATVVSEYDTFSGAVKGVVDHVGLRVGNSSDQDLSGNDPTTDQNSRVVLVNIKIDPADVLKVAALTDVQVRVTLTTTQTTTVN
ncbi:abc exporter membrane fusion family [Leptolyngbya sp. Heron Island J]|nr:abc exporter membrane fusion family [Leptolyngbya sp. Heron Island J]